MRSTLLCVATLFLTTCGGGGNSSNSASSLELFAGSAAGSGYADGTGSAARFNSPIGAAADSSGNIYVADAGNHVIRRITPVGEVTTLAGLAGSPGSADGTGGAARFNFPEGVAADGAGNVYVADTGNHTIRKITSAGVVSTLAGTAGISGNTNGNGSAARFNNPLGVAADNAGNVFVADTLNFAVRKIDSLGNVSTFVGSPTSIVPEGVATDSAGNVYVADGFGTVRRITPGGTVTTLAGMLGVFGSTDGTGAAASFNFPGGITVDGAGNAYVGDVINNTIRMITAAGVVTTIAGTAGAVGSADGTGAAASFSFPFGVAVSGGNIYVADLSNSTIRKIAPGNVVTTLAGTPRSSGSVDGTGTEARFNTLSQAVTDAIGNLYVTDFNNHTVRRITPAGVVTTFAGTAEVSGSADGIGSAARFNLPNGIAIDGMGNLYVSDSGNNTIRRMTSAGEVSTPAGTAGSTGSADGTGAAASFNFPTGLATDNAGNVYVIDTGNHTVRKMTPAGVVTTFAGTAGIPGSVDGTGAAAQFNNPFGVATDSAGNVYVAEILNHTIRKIAASGAVTTFAGTAGIAGAGDGNGIAARFNQPAGLALDDAGHLYVADFNNHTIRKISASGEVTTVVGVAGEGTFVPGALPGRLPFPIGVTISGSLLYIVLGDGVAVVRNRP